MLAAKEVSFGQFMGVKVMAAIDRSSGYGEGIKKLSVKGPLTRRFSVFRMRCNLHLSGGVPASASRPSVAGRQKKFMTTSQLYDAKSK